MRKIGRNEPCLCGSGKKHKKCCLDRVRDERNKSKEMTQENALMKYLEARSTHKYTPMGDLFVMTSEGKIRIPQEDL